MKRFNTSIGILLLGFTFSCEGPAGPQGLPGPEAQVIEVEVNFDCTNGTICNAPIITYSDITDVEVFESDAVLVYRLDGVIDLNDGSTADAWSLIPQNFFLDEGTIQYVFAHTFVDIELFIDGDFDLSNLDAGFKNNQIFRIVFVPGAFANTNRIDISNLSHVMTTLGIEEKQVKQRSID